MKTLRKILIVVLALVAMFSFATFTACDCSGKGGDQSQNQTQNGNQNTNNGGGNTKYEVIKFEKDEITMVVGDNTMVFAYSTSYSELPVTYTSKDPSIASVNSLGKVVAHRKGETKIVASSGGFEAECKVIVTHGNLQPTLNVYGLISESYVVPQGNTYALNYEVIFNGNKYDNVKLTVSTNNNNISTQVVGNVVNVTGNVKGETELTVNASWDGISGIPAMSKTVTVSVIGNVSLFVNNGATSEVVLANKVLTTYNGQTSNTAPFVVSATGTNAQPTIEIKDTSIATYSNGVITGTGKLGATEAVVSVTNEDNEVFSITIPVICERAIGDYLVDGDFQVIDFNTLTGNINELTDIFGKEVTLVEAFHGYDELVVENNKIVGGIQGQAFGEPEIITVTLYSEDEAYRVMMKPYVFKGATEISTSYQFSCIDGLFFNEDFVLENVNALLGGKAIVEAYLQTDGGQTKLPISVDRDAVLGVDIKGAELANYYIAIASEDRMIYIGATAYSLIIDEMSDFSYFYIPDGTWSYDRSKRWTVTSGMDWDGYYVLANDLTYNPVDPKNPQEGQYTHKGYESPYVHIGWSTNVTNANFASVGATQTEKNFATYGLIGKGLTGIFDGRGHVIDGFQNATWTAKGEYMNSMVDNALSQLGTISESNQKTANDYKNKGISASNGGLFQIVNGAVIRNVGFTNTKLSMTSGVFSSMTLNGAQIENVFIHVDPAYSYNKTGRYGTILHGSVSDSVIHRNVVVFNDTDKINERASGVFGQSSSTYAKSADKWSNVYVVSRAPLYGSCYSNSTIVDPFALYDAQYLDGVSRTSATGVVNMIDGVRRYTSISNFVADGANLVDSLATFDSSMWTLLDGVVPVFKNAIKNKDIEFYVGDTKLSDAGNQIVNNQNTKITAKYLGATIAEVDSVTITSGNNIVSADGAVVSATGLGSATADISYTYNGQAITASANLEVVAVINPVIKANDAQLVDGKVNLMLGETTQISLFSGNTAVEDFELEILSGNVITIDGKTIKASGTAYGTAQVAIKVNGGEYTFDVVVERPQVLANGVEIANFATVMEVDETFAITFKYNGAEVAGLALASSNTASVVVEGSTLKAIAQGESTITVSNEQGVSFTFTVFVTGGATLYAEELAYSAYDGVFFTKDLSRVVEYSEIFGGDVQILSAKDSAGNVYRVNDEGVVQGVKTTKEKGTISLTLYSKDTAIKVNAETYTLIIDEAEDFRYFTISGNVNITTTALSYDADDWNWNGYYVLAGNIDASDYTHVSTTGTLAKGHQSLDPALLAATNYGLSGVFDGQGYAVTNMYVRDIGSQNGLGLFGYVNGGVIKNVSFENIYSGKNKPAGATQTYSNVVHSPLINVLANGAKVQDVYLGVGHMAAASRYLLCATADASSTFERVIVRDTYGADNFGTWGGYVIGSGTKATLKEVYVIANFPVVTGGQVTVDIATDGVKAEKTLNRITADAKYVDGALASETYNLLHDASAHNVSYNLADDTDNIEIYKSSLDEKYEPYTISLLDGIKRYTSVEKMQADKAANDFSNWNANIWEINDGAPVFQSTLEVTAFINGLAIVEGATQSIVVGDELAVSLKLNGKNSSKVPTITVLEGADFVEIEGATIKAIANSNLTAVKVQISFNGNVWTQNVVIYNNITATPYATELYFSAHDGQFYDADFNVVSIDTIFGDDVDVIRAFDANGDAVTLGDNDELVNVDLGKNNTWKQTSFTLYTADVGLIINVKAADLIINEIEDLSYFQLKESATYISNVYKFAEGDFAWDGYHVLVTDLDGANYNDTGKKYAHDVENGMLVNASGAAAAISSRGIAEVEGVKTRGYMNSTGTEYIHGFMGTFDGNGHTISNITTDIEGLFGMVLGGTIKDVALVNCFTAGKSTLAFGIGAGASLENIYIETNDLAPTGKNGLSQSSIAIAKAFQTAELSNIVVNAYFGSSDLDSILTTSSLKYYVWAGSIGSINSDLTDLEEVYVVSILPTYMTKNISTLATNPDVWLVSQDAAYIDGVANESSNAVAGVKRYSSIQKMEDDKANNNFSSWDSNLWEIINGVPTFLGAFEGNYNATLNGIAVSEKAKDIVVDDVLQTAITVNGKNILGVPTVEVVEGNEFITVSGTTITAIAQSGANEVIVKISYRGNSWTQSFVIYNNITAEPHGGEFYFSAHDGQFYDAEFNVVGVDQIFGSDVDVIRAFDANGNALIVGENDQILNVDLGENDTWKATTLTLYTADKGLIINVQAADAIINEAEDFDAMKLKGTLTIEENYIAYESTVDNFEFDGYYVMVNDVDASNYAFVNAENMIVNRKGEKSDGSAVTIETVAATNYGFSGTFDGQGYTVKNLYVGSHVSSTQNGLALFTFLNGGTVKNVNFDHLHSSNNSYNPAGVSDKDQSLVKTVFANHILNGAVVQDVNITLGRLQAYAFAAVFNTAAEGTELTRVVVTSTDYPSINTQHYLFGYCYADVEDVYFITPTAASITTKTAGTVDGAAVSWHKARYEAEYLDGVKYENNSTTVWASNGTAYDLATSVVNDANGQRVSSYQAITLTGAKRYSSADKMAADVANNDFSKFNSDIWEIVNGIPTFVSTVSGEYVAYLNGEELTSSAKDVIVGDQLKVTIKAGDNNITVVPTITVSEGAEYVSVEGATIKADAYSNQTEVVVQIAYRNNVWTQSLVIYNDITPNIYAEDLYFSAHDGMFYDNDFNIVTIDDIFDSDVKVIRAFDANGERVLLGEDEQLLNIDLGANDTWKITSFTFYTVDAGYTVNVKAADLIIDEVEDLSYFQLKESATYISNVYNFAEGDFAWDGYYVLAKDIDGADYNGSGKKYAHDVENGMLLNASGAVAAISSRGISEVEGHKTRGYMNSSATEYLHGFMGTFDGMGNTISNITTDIEGLFGMVLGGTIKDVAFVNCVTLGKTSIAYGIGGGAVLENLYIETNDIVSTNDLSQSSNVITKATQTATLSNVVVNAYYGFNDLDSILYNGSLTYYVTAASIGLIDLEKTTASDVYVVSILPVSMSKNIKSLETNPDAWITTRDGAYIDGVANESSTAVAGIKRYSSIQKMEDDKANNNFSSWDSNLWEVINGVPTFLSRVSGEYVATLNGVELSESAMPIVAEDVLTASIKLGGKAVAGLPQVEVISGNEFITATENTITAIAESGENEVVVKISYRGYTWTQSFVVYPNIIAESHGVEYYFSAHDGKFYNNEFAVVSVSEIFGADVEIVRAYDANGKMLTVGENNEILNLDLGKNDTWKATTLTLYTADAGKIITVKAADLIIDEAEDFSYFTLKGNVDVSGEELAYDADDWYWDGYHVVVKDIDASNYAHHSNNAENPMPATAKTLAAAKIAPTNYGFSGTFDGQGYTVKNFYVGTVGGDAQSGLGLFTYVNGGTIKNVAFENIFTSSSAPKGVENHSGEGGKYIGVVYAPFINTMVNEAKVQDVYLGYYRMSGTGRYMVCAVSDDTCSIERVLVKDNYGLSSFANLGGSVVGSDSSATMTDVYVIDDVAVSIGGRFKATVTTKDESATVLVTGKWFNRIAADASIVDGVSIESSPYNYVFNSDDGKAYDLTSTEYSVYDDTNKLYPQPYTSINFLTGVKRYTSVATMKADAENNAFTNWSSSIWTITNGVPAMHPIANA